MIPIKEALKKYEWAREYYWKLVSVDADKYTAAAELHLHDGYVIRALPGARPSGPCRPVCTWTRRTSASTSTT